MILRLSMKITRKYYIIGDMIQLSIMFLKEGYCNNPNDGYSRIVECKQMIADLHAKGIRVVMDVVYNHMYDVNASAFERIVPGYYFRKNPDGSLSNGSWCGNDLDSGEHMVRKYIIDMSRRWQVFMVLTGIVLI